MSAQREGTGCCDRVGTSARARAQCEVAYDPGEEQEQGHRPPGRLQEDYPLQAEDGADHDHVCLLVRLPEAYI